MTRASGGASPLRPRVERPPEPLVAHTVRVRGPRSFLWAAGHRVFLEDGLVTRPAPERIDNPSYGGEERGLPRSGGRGGVGRGNVASGRRGEARRRPEFSRTALDPFSRREYLSRSLLPSPRKLCEELVVAGVSQADRSPLRPMSGCRLESRPEVGRPVQPARRITRRTTSSIPQGNRASLERRIVC